MILHHLDKERTITFCKTIEQTEQLGKNCIHSKNKDAEKVYFELRNKFIEDYGYYHESHTSQVKIPNTGSFLDEVFSMLFR
jgi:hypothetical protein